MVCLGLGVAMALTLLLSSVRQLLLIQAEDVMHKLVLLARLDHPTPEKHTQKDKHNNSGKKTVLKFVLAKLAVHQFGPD